ncbi:NmrA family NAD(P)-binding protein [Neptuniibacter sp.]|uniref:NmrA family NAD(P)-binding protein n=1 Tax=Neptuniibacter sp. TaxID=1962643 RepID=UPI0026381BD7|nr:NmrA family NAD(P)-binding protein [Neptuniibacter sp.]MCP4596257.1 NmrA family NAD(P)-binding protein [Neptuniibacter sp.]
MRHPTKQQKILVTAANGHTGYTTAKALLEGGLPVRVMVRNTDSEKVENLKALGAEVIRGNLDDYRDIQAALIDVQRAYFCAPFDRNALLKTANFVIAAEQAGLEHVVYMTQWLVAAEHPAINTREQWLGKQIAMLHNRVGYTFINTGLFSFTYFFTLQMVTQLGIYPTLLDEDQLGIVGLNAPPSEEDQGRVIAQILSDPESHNRQTYRITGPKLISHKDVIDTYSKVLGRNIKPMHISKKMLFKSLTAMGFPTYQLLNVSHYLDDLEQGAFSCDGGVTDVVKTITGSEAESFKTILKRELDQSNLRDRSFSKRICALRFFLKMLMTKAPDLSDYETQQEFPAFFEQPVLAMSNPKWKEEHGLAGRSS